MWVSQQVQTRIVQYLQHLQYSTAFAFICKYSTAQHSTVRYGAACPRFATNCAHKRTPSDLVANYSCTQCQQGCYMNTLEESQQYQKQQEASHFWQHRTNRCLVRTKLAMEEMQRVAGPTRGAAALPSRRLTDDRRSLSSGSQYVAP
jgi:hypothetical protein